MKSLKEIWENKTVRIVLLCVGALLLLIALWRVFFTSSPTYNATKTEERIEKILNATEGVDDATVMINEDGGEAVSVIVIYEGEDKISVRMRIIDITSSALNLSRSKVQVYPAGK